MTSKITNLQKLYFNYYFTTGYEKYTRKDSFTCIVLKGTKQLMTNKNQ